MPRLLFGPASSAAAPGRRSSASRARSWARLPPPAAWRARSSASNPGSSSSAARAASGFASPHSAPKQRVSQPRAASRKTPPSAKRSASAAAQGTGSSATRSAPPSSAARARVNFENTAGEPRCTKQPLITTATLCAPPRRSAAIWPAWPLWNGLYSAMTPTLFIFCLPLRAARFCALSPPRPCACARPDTFAAARRGKSRSRRGR